MATAKAFDFSNNGEPAKTPAELVSLKHATVFISRMTVRAVLVRELKNFGILKVNALDSAMECIEDMERNPAGLLVIDWEHGEQAVTKILRAAQGPHRVDTRPIYFMALDLADRVIKVANEFNVMQIHTGEISQAQIVKNLNELMQFSSISPASRKAYRELAYLRKNKDLDPAETLLRELCEDEPKNIRAAVELGAVLFEMAQYKEAKAWLTKVEAASRGDLRAQHLLARCHMKLGEFEEAEALLEKARLISPLHVDRLVDLGQILLNLDKVEAALGTFNQALKLDPDMKEAKIGKAQCNLLNGHVNEAIKLFGQIDSAQEVASIFNSSAILAIRQDRFKQGLNLYKSAVSHVAGEPHVLARVFFNMGVGLVKWGKNAPALAAFEKAASLDGTFDKATHNVSILKGLKTKGGQVSSPARLDDLASLSQEDEEFTGMDFGVSATKAKIKGPAQPVVEDDDELDDSYFQSLVSGS